MSLFRGRRTRDVVVAGAVGSLVGGVPSTVHALLTGGSVAEATLAAGTVIFRNERRPAVLVPAAAALHLALSLGWAAAVATVLPQRRMGVISVLAASCVIGAGIAVVDLGIVGRRYPRVRALPVFPQVADHIAYAAGVCFTLQNTRTSVR